MFLVLPSDAVEILDYLALGKRIGETQLIYQEKYGELPDIEDLLDILEGKGFVKPLLPNQANRSYAVIQATFAPPTTKVAKVRYNFANFPQSLAQKLFSRPVLLGCAVLISLALLAIAFDPALIPSWEAYFFPENTTLMILVLTVLDCVILFLHEMAHLVAARALGVSCRMGISNRMWMLVAETDMTGIWGVPRNQRYLPFLAGTLLDMVSAAILILVFLAQKHAGLKDLLTAILPQVQAQAADLIIKHNYELTRVLPALRRTISVRYPSLTDIAAQKEQIRNYPADRAFRIIHGIIDLLTAWFKRSQNSRWVIVCDRYDFSGGLVMI
ncbi:hypothetical protein [Nostoc sp.]|uniref:hypothetical protein n=1 Tax=Nostoc sp. TaxID=1180 RepID=UPI002FFD2109